MTRDELLARLQEIASINTYAYDAEQKHLDADRALLAFIGDDEISKAWDEIDKWYA